MAVFSDVDALNFRAVAGDGPTTSPPASSTFQVLEGKCEGRCRRVIQRDTPGGGNGAGFTIRGMAFVARGCLQ
jgi:hypothetical protein